MVDTPIHRRGASIRSLVLGSSLSALTLVGTLTPSMAQDDALRDACAAVLKLRDTRVIEQLLVEYAASSPCIPLLLSALSARDLSRINPDLVAALPRAQLRRIPSAVLEQLGIDGRLGDSRGISAVEQPTNSDPYPY